MTYYDHFFILLFAVLFPIVGYLNYQKLLKEAAKGNKPNRVELYIFTIITQWSLCIAGIILWYYMARDWALIGFDFVADSGFFIAVLIAMVVIALLVMQLLSVKSMTKEQLSQVHTSLGHLMLFLPKTKNDLSTFYGVSFTAGVVEEILWRGVLIWYLSHYVPLWVAAGLNIVLFALAHSYQGVKHLPTIFIVGVLFTGLYLISGSIWIPVITHVAIDMLQGTFAQRVLARCAEEGILSSQCQDTENHQ